MSKLACLLAVAAACGDNARDAADAPPAPAIDAPAATCTAELRGNLVDRSAGSADCPTLGSGELAFALAVPQLAIPLAIALDLGPDPAPGDYSSETIHDWSVSSYQRDTAGGGGACLYSAGGSATPSGNFELALTAVDGAGGSAHGSLAITAWVLVFPGTSCGTDDTETIQLAF
jgi:hypothetical protein|nr:hypothetical protein [Kofleriaceae bacterium]